MGGYPEGQVHVDLKERGKGGDLKWFHPVWRSKTLRNSECDPALNVYCERFSSVKCTPTTLQDSEN